MRPYIFLTGGGASGWLASTLLLYLYVHCSNTQYELKCPLFQSNCTLFKSKVFLKLWSIILLLENSYYWTLKSESDSEQDKINSKWWEATREILAFSWLLLPFSTVFMEVSSDKNLISTRKLKKFFQTRVSSLSKIYSFEPDLS